MADSADPRARDLVKLSDEIQKVTLEWAGCRVFLPLPHALQKSCRKLVMASVGIATVHHGIYMQIIVSFEIATLYPGI